MTNQVAVKGESVYQCNVCQRRVRVPTNKFSLDVMPTCNITLGCKGSLSRVTLTKDINDTPAFAPEVVGLTDWYQRKMLFTHQQPISSSTWVVSHGLSCKPIIHVYTYQLVNGVSTLVPQEPDIISIVDANTVKLTFPRPVNGLAQCVALASENKTNVIATIPQVQASTPLQITTNYAELTIATLTNASTVDLTLSFLVTSGLPPLNIVYTGIDTTTALTSPWAGIRRVVVNGRRYTVRTLNIGSGASAAVNAFDAGQIPNGSGLQFTQLNGSSINQHDVLLLLAQTPFTTVDKIYDQYVDVSLIDSVDPETYWDSGKGYCRFSAVKTTYPAILVV